MIRTVCCLLLCCPLLQAQTVKTSDYRAGWVTLPKPPALVYHSHVGSNPQPPAVYEWAYSLVDDTGRISPMSPSVKINAPRNYTISVKLQDGMFTRACAYVLWSRRVGGSSPLGPAGNGELEWRSNGANKAQQPRPFLALTGLPDHSLRARAIQPTIRWYAGNFSERFEDETFFPRSTVLAAPDHPPLITVYHIPNRAYEVCYTWVGNEGESPLSDVITVLPNSESEDFNNPFWLQRPGCPPQGALGFYLYLRVKGESNWHRQPRRHVDKYSTRDDFLWGLTQIKVSVDRFVESKQSPATRQGRSWLTSLQQAIEQTNQSILVDSPQELRCPVIMPFRAGQSMRRTISALNGASWDLTTVKPSPGTALPYPTEWPMWVETSQYTRLVGCNMESSTAECGIDFLSYDGSTCFHFRAERCSIKLWRSLIGRKYSAAIRQLAHFEGAHTCSEPIFIDCDVWARHGVVCEGGQSANWEVRSMNAVSAGGLESSILSINNSGSFLVSGRITTDGARAFIAAVNIRQVTVENWYSDRGFPCWVCFSTPNTATTLNITVNQINHWPSSDGAQGDWDWLHVAEMAQAGEHIAKLRITGLAANHYRADSRGQPFEGGAPRCRIFCPRYAGLDYRLPNNSLLSQLKVHEESRQWWNTHGTEFQYPIVGMVWHSYQSQWDHGKDAAQRRPEIKTRD
ncbi:MAG: hypothetical protein JNJ77_16630 [Planctomycetia bacterium]|nr:hypothetical protein [Planctomycetia bacterium]